MKDTLLIIFVKNQELGKVKTRLAKSIGKNKALEIYSFLLKKTKEITSEITCDKCIYYSNRIEENDIWDKDYTKYVQHGNDLGYRMKNAFKDAFFKGYKKVVLIGSDLYDLTPIHLDDAFKSLDSKPVVLGPAQDGGYYLIGLTKVYPKIFKNKAWGTSSVRKDTLSDLEKVNVHLLEMLNDVDVIEDIQQHPAFQKFLN